MKKIISFLVLVTCGVIAFFYLSQDTISTTQSTKQEPRQSNKANQELLPEQTPTPSQNAEIPPPPPPGHRQYNPPPTPAVPDENPKTAERRTNPETVPETEERDSEEPLSYPIEDAEIYFVPPEQRYPGNLGGPPPLNIPDQDFPEQ